MTRTGWMMGDMTLIHVGAVQLGIEELVLELDQSKRGNMRKYFQGSFI